MFFSPEDSANNEKGRKIEFDRLHPIRRGLMLTQPVTKYGLIRPEVICGREGQPGG